ncbi:hypothetical protein [Polyangium fumosum]|uniref:Uncharacterized protein n=1 Tax=Polyangium fumosum TaxID=889272 RepID=A0A4U1JHG5_9BACT|nr:hypothetical protein [Polyangium fumosum]TKD11858.1 hypothetical protein E8A74_06920 [Polyangium fumosum]
MQGRATKWMCGIVATLGVVVLAMGCSGSDGYGACPADNGSDEVCVWEGGITFVPDKVLLADGFVFVHGEMMWSPCAMTPGKQIRSYGIDPMTAVTERMDAPADAEPVPIPAQGKIEVKLEGTMRRVVIDPSATISVNKSKLPIGEVVNDDNGITVPIELEAVCDE